MSTPAPLTGMSRAGAVVLSAVMAASCSSDSERATLPAPPQVVKVDMKEYAFVYDSNIRAGRVVFEVRNIGRRPHRISLSPLSEDVPPIQEQIRGTSRRSATPFAGMPPQPPRQSASFAVDLAPGVRYAMICFINEDGLSHAQEGMVSEFRPPANVAARQRPRHHHHQHHADGAGLTRGLESAHQDRPATPRWC